MEDMVGKIKDIVTGSRLVTLLILLGVLLAIVTIITPRFMTGNHLYYLMRDLSFLGIIAIGQTVVILTGGLDMSVGGVYFLSSSACAAIFSITGISSVSIFLVLLMGAGIGLAQGIGVTKMDIPPIVMTLGTLISLTGLTFLVIGPTPSGEAPPILQTLGGSYAPVVLWIGIVGLFYVILERTSYGRKIHLIGSNPVASHFAGIKVDRVTMFAYVISSTLSAFAGLLYLGWAVTPYISFTSSAMGVDMVVRSIAAVVIGGTLFVGGRGGVERTFIGTIIIGVLFSFMVMVGLGEAGKLVAQGVAIIGIVALYKEV